MRRQEKAWGVAPRSRQRQTSLRRRIECTRTRAATTGIRRCRAGGDASEDEGKGMAGAIFVSLQTLFNCPQCVGQGLRLDDDQAGRIKPEGNQTRSIGASILAGIVTGLNPDHATARATGLAQAQCSKA